MGRLDFADGTIEIGQFGPPLAKQPRGAFGRLRANDEGRTWIIEQGQHLPVPVGHGPLEKFAPPDHQGPAIGGGRSTLQGGQQVRPGERRTRFVLEKPGKGLGKSRIGAGPK